MRWCAAQRMSEARPWCDQVWCQRTAQLSRPLVRAGYIRLSCVVPINVRTPLKLTLYAPQGEVVNARIPTARLLSAKVAKLRIAGHQSFANEDGR